MVVMKNRWVYWKDIAEVTELSGLGGYDNGGHVMDVFTE